jgi:hypothetical protein
LCPHDVRRVFYEDGGTRIEVHKVGDIGVEADVSIEPVGLSQSPDTDTGWLSRGIRPQR